MNKQIEKKYNLEALKSLALEMLSASAEDSSDGNIIHPFFDTAFFSFDGSTYHATLHEHQFLLYKHIFGNSKILAAKSLDEIVALFKAHYLLLFLDKAFELDLLNAATCGEILLENWQNITLYSHDDVVRKGRVFRWLNEYSDTANARFEDESTYRELPDKIKIYHGYKKEGSFESFSWTTDFNTAKRYATRFRPDLDNDYCPQIASGVIDKKHIYRAFAERREVVVDFREIGDIRVEHARIDD